MTNKITYKALTIAYWAHREAKEAYGMPYILHPLRVMERLDDETLKAVALLHDVVEDTDLTLEDLKKEGIPEKVLSIVDIMTHREKVSYEDYISRIATSPEAIAVKLADIEDNTDLSRFRDEEEMSTDKVKRRMTKYMKARRKLLAAQEALSKKI